MYIYIYTYLWYACSMQPWNKSVNTMRMFSMCVFTCILIADGHDLEKNKEDQGTER